MRIFKTCIVTTYFSYRLRLIFSFTMTIFINKSLILKRDFFLFFRNIYCKCKLNLEVIISAGNNIIGFEVAFESFCYSVTMDKSTLLIFNILYHYY